MRFSRLFLALLLAGGLFAAVLPAQIQAGRASFQPAGVGATEALISVPAAPIDSHSLPGGGQAGAALTPDAVAAYTYQFLKLSTALADDGRGDVIVERRLTNVDIANWTSDTWYFDWYPGHYSKIRAWDDQGPLGVTTSQSGTRIYVTVFFRRVILTGQTYHLYLALTIEQMASISNGNGRAAWYWYPAQPVQLFVQAVTFPPNSTFQSVAPTPTTKSAAYLDWQFNNTSADWKSTIDVSYTLASAGSSSVVKEARLDIGMPYDAARGCTTPYIGCGGPYHGFYNGVCTDLVLDAYNFGVPFSIQGSLSQDAAANPGRYRYATARNAEDMRRYFSFNQQMLAKDQSYQRGDIAFFDWGGDGLTDHVLIVSEVDASGRPLGMVDASGAYSGNPRGLAFEHPWSTYYDRATNGHGRLGPSTAALFGSPAAESLQVLSVTLNAADPVSAELAVVDGNGKFVSSVFDENLIASNVEAYIPYIPGGKFASAGWTKTVTVYQPLSNSPDYTVQIAGSAPAAYNLSAQTLQDGAQTATQTFAHTISAGETQAIPLHLSEQSGVIAFTASPLRALPTIVINPSPIRLRGVIGSTASLGVHVAEQGGLEGLADASVRVGDLTSTMGQTIPGVSLSVVPATFSLGVGGQQRVELQLSLANLSPGVYLGNLLVASPDGYARSVPLSLSVDARTVSLPLIVRQ